MEFTDKERRAYRSLSMADLYWFTRWMFINRRGYAWQQAAHHIHVCEALMKVFRGEIKRLIINIPPRYSKTEIVKNFIGWALGHYPDCEFIYTSYSARLAAASSWDVRGLVQEPEYQAIFPGVQLRDDSKAKDEWRTSAGGIVYAVGSEGTITGYGAGKLRPGFGGALLIDDPHKADEARSDVMRQNVIDWFQNTFESRKNSPETPIILIMQRLHESDLAGWLLAGGNGEKWEHVCLPALHDDGTALWPEKHGVEELRRMEAAAPYTFAGQYQQRPSPAEGGIFKPDQIRVIDALPYGHIQWVRGWDLASTTDGDFTAGGKIGKLPDGRFVIGDMVRLRVGPDERDAAMVNTASLDGVSTKISIPQDPGQAGKTQVLYLTRQLAGYPVDSSPESGDKVTRAEPFAAQVNVGNVVMLRGSWNAALIDEMRMFPNGSFDDQIDSLSRAFSHLIGGGLSLWAKLAE
ncbi:MULTISPECIES: phage terminase large subunit [unclassified Burkholderia]|uniref:phage terminase large subunit n=1 Tax=unclassified Burkholderia TaxID=2613784 RepID=UPI000F57EDAF|nr:MULTISPECIES: phage terminase large subunit [unclassified Burkholderia]RQR87714.1 terminase [Burkholderia sp. Bp9011]RQR97057.1 terminase [Burkholderia sp. Bp9010]